MPIRQLAPDVAAKIAAGEVVERPASVVKELIENSIDAGATQIRVDLNNGGLQLIRVTDNGSGIAVEELPLALARHATSKVAEIADLEHIRSLGFRGEALASIAAVAEVTLLSRQRGVAQGAQISAVNGQLSDVGTAAAAEGTTITVRNLFSAVPARLKFLKSRNTEVSHCHHLLEQYALAYPEIRFSVFSEGRQIFATPGDGQLASVLVEVYGLQVADQMVPIASPSQADDESAPVVSGYVSRPVCYKSTRQYISFFVNRRWVLSRMLTAAVEGAYHSLLLTGRHPVAVVNITLDPTLLDVNVHPAKTEIRFLKERRVFAAVLRAVRQALLTEPEMPQWEPQQDEAVPSAPTPLPDNRRTRQEKRQQAVSTPDDDLLDLDLGEPEPDATDHELNSGAPTPTRTTTRTIPEDNPWITVTEEETGSRPPMLALLWQSHVHSATTEQKTPPRAASVSSNEIADTVSDAPLQQSITLPTQPASGTAASTYAGRRDDTWLSQSDTVAPVDPPEGQTVEPQQTRRLPRLRVVGQVAQSYIVTEGEDGMYLIDQHAAHERILLERMIAAMKVRTPLSQLLLTPLMLELAPRELEAIEEHQQQLLQIGFTLESTDTGTLSVCAVPGVLVKHMNAHSLHELLCELTSEESLGDTETWEERALANVACKAAIKANYFLTLAEMREMLEQLEQTRAPYSCCHGRPTMVHFSQSALARAFERR